MPNDYHPWQETGESEVEYFHRRYLEESGEAEKAEAARLKLAIALQGLTPGGSEFQTPEACVEWVRRRYTGDHERVLTFAKAKKAAEARLAEAERLLREAAGQIPRGHHPSSTAERDAHGRIVAFLAAAPPAAPLHSPGLASPAVTEFFDSLEGDFPADPEAPAAPPEPPGEEVRHAHGDVMFLGDGWRDETPVVLYDAGGDWRIVHAEGWYPDVGDAEVQFWSWRQGRWCLAPVPWELVGELLRLAASPPANPLVERVVEAGAGLVDSWSYVEGRHRWPSFKEDATLEDDPALMEWQEAVAALRAAREAGNG